MHTSIDIKFLHGHRTNDLVKLIPCQLGFDHRRLNILYNLVYGYHLDIIRVITPRIPLDTLMSNLCGNGQTHESRMIDGNWLKAKFITQYIQTRSRICEKASCGLSTFSGNNRCWFHLLEPDYGPKKDYNFITRKHVFSLGDRFFVYLADLINMFSTK